MHKPVTGLQMMVHVHQLREHSSKKDLDQLGQNLRNAKVLKQRLTT